MRKLLDRCLNAKESQILAPLKWKKKFLFFHNSQSYRLMQVDDFVRYVTNMSQAYNTQNVIITMGEDFNYQLAQMWFKNLDKLIK